MENYVKVYSDLIEKELTLVTPERFDMIIKHANNISKLEGDIIECGVWRGGMTIFLTKIFPNKTIWASDSFQGFQPIGSGNYSFSRERHGGGGMAVDFETVKTNFINNDALTDKVKFLKGFVKDTLTSKECTIEKLSLLRVDVDAYSATLEVLDALYDKVVSGGYIIFDDTCLVETHEAVKTFFTRINKKYVIDPSTENLLDVFVENHLPCGCYFIKD